MLDVGYSLVRGTVEGLSAGSLQCRGGTTEWKGLEGLSTYKKHHVFKGLECSRKSKFSRCQSTMVNGKESSLI